MNDSQEAASQRAAPAHASWRELALLFLKLGTIAFGGPAAHIALMEDEVVRRRQWLTHEEFLDLPGATNLIPGPNSTEMAVHIGHRQAGWPGLQVAGTCFFVDARTRGDEDAIAGRGRRGWNYSQLSRHQRTGYSVRWRHPCSGRQLDRATIAKRPALALVDLPTIAHMLVSAVMLFRFRVNSAWLVLGGAIIGLLLRGRL